MVDRLHALWLSPQRDHLPPVVLLHGFTQNARAWGTFGDLLGAHRPVLAVDLPGHGGSDAIRRDLPGTADLVAALLEDLPTPAAVVGYSMGGRVALHLTLRRPELLDRLVLVSTTAGIDDEEERARRRADDESLADHIEQVGVDAFLDEWLAQPLFAGLDEASAGRAARRENSAAGLASSLRLCGTGTQTPLWGDLPGIEVPTLVVVGELDARFRVLGERLVRGIGANATLALVQGAGHNAPLERAVATLHAILD